MSDTSLKMFFWSPFGLSGLWPRLKFCKMTRSRVPVWLEFSSSLPDYSEQRGAKQEMCQTQLSSGTLPTGPGEDGLGKSCLPGLAVAPHPKWEADKRRPLCIQSTSNYPGAASPLCGSPLLPLSSLQLSALWPFSCPSEPQSEGGQVEEGRGSKIQISHFIAVP